MTAPDTDPSAILAGIKERAARLLPLNRKPYLLAEEVAELIPPLVAALEAAIGHHVQAVIEDMPDPFRYCGTCAGHPAWPCPEVRDITAALTREETQGE